MDWIVAKYGTVHRFDGDEYFISHPIQHGIIHVILDVHFYGLIEN